MVSHSSSASLSSFHFSHTSSSSSPSSSPDSSSQQYTCFATPSTPSTLALVPFLWEEKPGVLKKTMQISEGGHDRCSGEGSPSQGHPPFSFCDAAAHAPAHGHSSKRMSRTFPASRSKQRSESVPHLRPPPRLSQPNLLHVYAQSEDEADNHHQWRTATAGVKSKVMPSFSLHKRRHHRAPSLEDDPFWMAMVACTNDGGKGSRTRYKSGRNKASAEIQRGGDSWFARRVQGHTIHFEQCMPHRTAGSCTTSNVEKSRRSVKSEGASEADTKNHGEHDCADTSVHSAHLASKAFKALNIAKSELHGRCKVLLRQQSSPVDISCSTRRSKKPSFASKRKLPDLFGCKSHHPLSNIPS